MVVGNCELFADRSYIPLHCIDDAGKALGGCFYFPCSLSEYSPSFVLFVSCLSFACILGFFNSVCSIYNMIVLLVGAFADQVSHSAAFRVEFRLLEETKVV